LREEYIKLKDKRQKTKLVKHRTNKERKHRQTQWPKEKGQNDKQRSTKITMLFLFLYYTGIKHDFHNQMMFVSLNSNTMGVTCGAGMANPSGAP
jgi:hypothetical protein